MELLQHSMCISTFHTGVTKYDKIEARQMQDAVSRCLLYSVQLIWRLQMINLAQKLSSSIQLCCVTQVPDTSFDPATRRL